jgi:NAD(P)-dependent dehydrogenase (short-subunit alcohol dehydrogenase family)
MMQQVLAGKGAIITGGTSGIGLATARCLAEQGANLVICGRNAQKGQEIQSELQHLGPKIKFIPCDVSSSSQVKEFFNDATAFLGKIDAAFNNAGIEGQVAMFNESSEENWDEVMNINLKGIWHCMKHEISHMLANGGGSIVNMSSTSGLVGNGFGMTAYAASKHAVIGLTI